MDLEETEKNLTDLKKRPAKTIGLLVVALGSAAVLFFLNGYFGERGRAQASTLPAQNEAKGGEGAEVATDCEPKILKPEVRFLKEDGGVRWGVVEKIRVQAQDLEHPEVLVCGFHRKMLPGSGPGIPGGVLELRRVAGDPCLWEAFGSVQIDLNRSQVGEAVIILGGGDLVSDTTYHRLDHWPSSGTEPESPTHRYSAVLDYRVAFDTEK